MSFKMSLIDLTGSDDDHEQRVPNDRSMVAAAIAPESNAAKRGRKQGFAIFLDSSDDKSTDPVVRKKSKRFVVKVDNEKQLTSKPKPITTTIIPFKRTSIATKLSATKSPGVTNIHTTTTARVSLSPKIYPMFD